MFTQPKDPNNKNKSAYTKYCSYCHRTNHSMSACFKKQRDDEDNEVLMLDQNLHKNHLYSTSVLLLTIEQNTMIFDIEVEVLHVTTLTTRLVHKIDTVLHVEMDLAMTKVMILINAIHDLTALHTDLLIDILIDTTLALDIDLDIDIDIDIDIDMDWTIQNH